MTTVLVTGAASGLGRALAEAYARRGARIVSVVRPGRADECVAGPVIAVDLARLAELETIGARLLALGIDRLDLVIHNAAAGWVGPLEAMPPEAVDALVATNLTAPISLTHALVPFVERARGKFVMIGSIAAFLPAPAYAVYAATKAALDGFARALHVELEGRVAIQIVHPGPIRTGFHARAGATGFATERFPAAGDIARRTIACIGTSRWRAFPRLRERVLARVGDWARPVVDRFVRRGASARFHPASAPHAVVTGAASGLGAALAARLASAGFRVTGLDLASGTDLADPAARAAAIERLAALPPATLLVHSAGTSATGPFDTQPRAAIDRVIATNLVAPMQLTVALSARGALAQHATVVVVSSLSHYVGYPGAAIYAATKDGLASFGRSLGAGGRHCLTVLPGPMRTPHAERFAPRGAPAHGRLDPDRAAALILQAVQSGRSRLVIGRGAHLAMIAGRIAPTLTTRFFGRAMLRRLRESPPVG